MLLLIDFALLALAVIFTKFMNRRGQASRRRAEADAAARLAAAGLQAKGELLGTFVARPVDGLEVVLTNRTPQTRPGASEPTGTACVARIAVPLVDQIVCKAAEADLVMGPLPAVPRVRTGYAPFDDVYAVFVGVAGGAPDGGSYRAAPVAGDIPWAQTPLLESLLELELHWLRVQEGRADLVFPALEIEDVGRAAALAAAVEHAAAGRPAPVLTRGPRIIRPPRGDVGVWTALAWGLGVFPGLLVGMLLTFAPPLQDLDAWVCGAGDRIITASSDLGDGTSYGCRCAGHPENSLALHYLGSGLLGMALVVLIGLGVTYARVDDED